MSVVLDRHQASKCLHHSWRNC